MELQLAEKYNLPYNPYIWIPNVSKGGGVYVREDKFDQMTENDFDDFMEEIAPYQMEDLGLSEEETVNLLAGFKSRRAERREEKKQKRQAKLDNKKSKTEARRSRATSKAEARKTRAQAKQTKADAKKARAEAGEEEEGSQWGDKILDTASKIMNRNKGGDSEGSGAEGEGEGEGKKKKKDNTIYWVIGGVAGALAIGGVIYAVTKKKN